MEKEKYEFIKKWSRYYFSYLEELIEYKEYLEKDLAYLKPLYESKRIKLSEKANNERIKVESRLIGNLTYTRDIMSNYDVDTIQFLNKYD